MSAMPPPTTTTTARFVQGVTVEDLQQILDTCPPDGSVKFTVYDGGQRDRSTVKIEVAHR